MLQKLVDCLQKCEQCSVSGLLELLAQQVNEVEQLVMNSNETMTPMAFYIAASSQLARNATKHISELSANDR